MMLRPEIISSHISPHRFGRDMGKGIGALEQFTDSPKQKPYLAVVSLRGEWP